MNSVNRAVLLAAGRGTRLQPYTDTTPKPLLVYRGKPTLDYLLESLLEAGVAQVTLVVHHLSEQIEQYARAWSASHAQSLDLVHQSHLFGTAHALQQIIEQRPEFVSQSFVLCATDYVVPKKFFSDLLRFHDLHNGEMTISLKSIEVEEKSSRSIVRRTDDGAVLEIIEKPDEGTAPGDTGANLCFILPSDISQHVMNVSISPRGEHEIQDALNSWIKHGGRAFGYLQDAPEEWQAPLRE